MTASGNCVHRIQKLLAVSLDLVRPHSLDLFEALDSVGGTSRDQLQRTVVADAKGRKLAFPGQLCADGTKTLEAVDRFRVGVGAILAINRLPIADSPGVGAHGARVGS